MSCMHIYEEMMLEREEQDTYSLSVYGLRWRDTFLYVVLFSLFLVMQGCTQKANEQGALPQVTPGVSPPWVKTFNRQDIINSVCRTTDGGFIAAGKTNFRHEYPDAWIVKLDAGGNVQWQRGFGEKYQDEFHAVLQTNDGGYLAAGMTIATGTSPENGMNRGLLVKFTPQGTVQWQKAVSGFVFKSLVQMPRGLWGTFLSI